MSKVHSKYAELLSPGKFMLKEEELEITDDQVLVKVLVSGICKYDLTYYKGILGTFPARIGHEPTGIVEQVGRNVRQFKPGDRVTGLYQKAGLYQKGFATYAVGDPESLVEVPGHVPLEHALGEPLKCVSTILRAASPEFGDYVLLIGCGFMGLLVLAGLVGQGPEMIIAADVSDRRLALAAELGAQVTLNPSKVDLEHEVARLTHRHGVDVAIELTGSPEPVEMAARTLRPGRAKFILAGWHGVPATYNLRCWTHPGAIVHCPHPAYSLDPMDDLRRAINGLARGIFPMERLITHRFTLDEIQKAFEVADKGGEDYIKGIILPWG
ncbi:MAG: zinc-dependent alcohol dehydrogenase [Anaerolineae bacterium]